MSKKQDETLTNDKALANDEAFIDALYADIESIEINNTEISNKAAVDQPSKELDQRILNAAHKAVAHAVEKEKAQVVELANVKSVKSVTNSKRKKLFAWTVPLASAASLVLVVSLVVNQNDEQIMTIDNDIILQDATQSAMQSPVPIAVQSELLLESKMAAKYKVVTLAQQKQLEQRKQRKKMQSKMESRAEQKRQQQSTSMLSFADIEATKTSILAATSVVKNDSAINEKPILTHQQFLLFEKQQKYWILVSENEHDYVINIFDNKNDSAQFIQYKLLKESFHLKKLVTQINSGKKLLLKEFEVISTGIKEK